MHNIMTTDLFTEAELAERFLTPDDLLVESLQCLHCDGGMEHNTIADAIRAGWVGIEYTPDQPLANYTGICPECQQEEQSA